MRADSFRLPPFFCTHFMLDIRTSVTIPDDTCICEYTLFIFVRAARLHKGQCRLLEEPNTSVFVLSTVTSCKYSLSRFVLSTGGRRRQLLVLVANSCLFADYL